MSALSGIPRLTRQAPRAVVRTATESFWTIVALGLGLFAFFAVAGGSTVLTLPVVVAGLALLGLWGLHARSVRRHAGEEHQDERWRRARERRGF
jgi:fatty acid desaturase